MIIQKYFRHQIKLNARNKEFLTLLHLACINGQSKIVEMLIEKSTEFNIHWPVLQIGDMLKGYMTKGYKKKGYMIKGYMLKGYSFQRLHAKRLHF